MATTTTTLAPNPTSATLVCRAGVEDLPLPDGQLPVLYHQVCIDAEAPYSVLDHNYAATHFPNIQWDLEPSKQISIVSAKGDQISLGTTRLIVHFITKGLRLFKLPVTFYRLHLHHRPLLIGVPALQDSDASINFFNLWIHFQSMPDAFFKYPWRLTTPELKARAVVELELHGILLPSPSPAPAPEAAPYASPPPASPPLPLSVKHKDLHEHNAHSQWDQHQEEGHQEQNHHSHSQPEHQHQAEILVPSSKPIVPGSMPVDQEDVEDWEMEGDGGFVEIPEEELEYALTVVHIRESGKSAGVQYFFCEKNILKKDTKKKGQSKFGTMFTKGRVLQKEWIYLRQKKIREVKKALRDPKVNWHGPHPALWKWAFRNNKA